MILFAFAMMCLFILGCLKDSPAILGFTIALSYMVALNSAI